MIASTYFYYYPSYVGRRGRLIWINDKPVKCGRLENIEDSEYLFPLISDDYDNAVGSVSGNDEVKAILIELADSVHKNNKIIRLSALIRLTQQQK